jgi:hypothetical protein
MATSSLVPEGYHGPRIRKASIRCGSGYPVTAGIAAENQADRHGELQSELAPTLISSSVRVVAAGARPERLTISSARYSSYSA